MGLEIKTKRLHLKLLQEEDITYLMQLDSDPEVRKFFPSGVQDQEKIRARIKEFISCYRKKGLPCFCIFLRSSNEFVGRCGFGLIETGEIEVGYVLHRKFWGKGYASEALEALLAWARKNIDADYIIAFSPCEHVASQKVMRKCSMEYYKNDIGHGVKCCFYRITNRDI